MAHIRLGNRPKIGGSPSRWAFKLAARAAHEMVRQRVGTSMFVADIDEIDRWMLILPRLTNDGAEVLVLFRPKLAADRLREINYDFQSHLTSILCELWERYCHGYVLFRIPTTSVYRLGIVDHNATVRSTLEIDDIDQEAAPQLADYDASIGTSLVKKNGDWAHRCSRAVSAVARAEAIDVHAN